MIFLVSDGVMNPFAKAIQPPVKLGLIPGLVLCRNLCSWGVPTLPTSVAPSGRVRDDSGGASAVHDGSGGAEGWAQGLRISPLRRRCSVTRAPSKRPGAGAKSTLSRGR